jgi:hypothetical protein
MSCVMVQVGGLTSAICCQAVERGFVSERRSNRTPSAQIRTMRRRFLENDCVRLRLL